MENQQFKGAIAYGLAPHEGGTTTVYHLLARGLRALGWRVFAVAAGEQAAREYDPRFGDEFSIILAPEETTLAGQVVAFLDWAAKEKVDIIIPNCEDNIIAAIRHLPAEIRYISICHTVSRSGYLLSSIYSDRLSFAVAINPRQRRELENRWHIPSSKLQLIPHGIDFQRFFMGAKSSLAKRELRLVYLGRIHDMDKGVMWLSPILREITNQSVPFMLDLVGSGPDLAELQKRFESLGLSRRIKVHGQLTPNKIPQILAHADIFLMPSRFEGFGLTLVEAMAAGCVPIATHLQGITDMIVEDGVSGFLCPMGDTGAFAQKIIDLYNDRTRLARMAEAAQDRVRDKFSLERMVADYDALFTQALSEPPVAYVPRPLGQLAYPKELQPTWRTRVPLPVKNLARKVLYRCFGHVP
jgi:glycosyltransferase involved in cell wall biosynthesis